MEYITRSNYGMQIGSFNISPDKKYLVFESKAVYKDLEPECLGNLVREYLMKSIASYKAYAYGVVTIIDSFLKQTPINIKNIVNISENRVQPTRRHQEPQIAEDRKQEETSEESSVESDSDEDNTDSVLSESSDGEEEIDDNFERELELLEFIQNSENLKKYFDFDNLQKNDRVFIYEGYMTSTLKKYMDVAD